MAQNGFTVEREKVVTLKLAKIHNKLRELAGQIIGMMSAQTSAERVKKSTRTLWLLGMFVLLRRKLKLIPMSVY
jgi:hypothetical protein